MLSEAVLTRINNRIRGGVRAAWAITTTLLITSITCSNAALAANTILVGPLEEITRIADAARIAQDGDTVLILPGEYRGDVTVWTQRALTIRGLDQRPVLIADGQSAEGKAIWVFRNGDYTVDNIEFRGARVGDGNGAGIRFEGGRLEVSNASFLDNQMGILASNNRDAQLIVRDSVFSEAPRHGSRLSHLLYVGQIARLEVSGSRFHSGYRGHLIKSRARHSDIRYNLIFDGPGGGASYELEFPNGGNALVVGNVIGQSAQTQNRVIVAYGAEGDIWPENSLLLAHNTLITEGIKPALFGRVWEDKLPNNVEVVTRNNLTVGFGAFTTTLPGKHAGNMALPPGTLGAAETLDFTFPENSLLRKTLSRIAGNAEGSHGRPTQEFAFPVGTQELAPPIRWLPGAFQSPVIHFTR